MRSCTLCSSFLNLTCVAERALQDLSQRAGETLRLVAAENVCLFVQVRAQRFVKTVFDQQPLSQSHVGLAADR